MRIPNEEHESGPWRIREIAHDFKLEDVWALPARGGPGDFPELLQVMAGGGIAGSGSLPARALWAFRDLLGKWFGLGRVSDRDEHPGALPIPGSSEHSLRERLPADLRDTVGDVDLGPLPFEPLYLADREFAAEVSNQTVHGVLHLAWAEVGEARYQGQMAVYVKPRGLLGHGYMALIKPFRYLIIYPALMKQIERAWSARA